jgi:predicted HicB family RNase H-like nuclease
MVKLTIRIPDDLHADLATAAAEDQRSLNGEILWLLRQAIAARAKS